ncbi:MAG: ATP-binding protein [Moraxellaceae bacterium]|nr:ATP-binding protein [Moraxellaceae bacterium]
MSQNPDRASPSSATARSYEEARLAMSRISVGSGHSLRQCQHELARLVAAALEVSRVSIWLAIDEGRAIRCDCLFQPGRDDVCEGVILHQRDFPEYFLALSVRRVIAVTDVADDPLVEEFREPYFRPLGITSMLDAPIYQAGEVVGIVCHEHVGAVREWQPSDSEFAAAVADTISRLYAESAQLQAEHALGAYQTQVNALQRVGSLGRLAAGMAHDFKNVLSAVFGYADLITDAAKGNPEVLELAEELVHAAERGQELTQQLLTLAQETPSRPRVTDVVTLIEQYRSMLGMAVGSRVSLRLRTVPVSRVFVDGAQLERVLLNLVVNARDALPPAGGEIAIAVYEAVCGNEGTQVVIEVRDNGSGMDADTRDRIFEPFFTTKGDAGTGLGMAIVQQVITHAGGRVEVESEPGSGTAIRLCLPGIAVALNA